MGGMADVQITRNDDEHRYEAHLDGAVAGYAEYVVDGSTITFTHTVVGDEYEGKGVASALARYSLDEVRSRGGMTVVPQCPFYRGWIEKHPDYQDLL